MRHWVDLRIRNTEFSHLAKRISQHSGKEPVDLSRRTLVRIFANGSFEEGGRFYRGDI